MRTPIRGLLAFATACSAVTAFAQTPQIDDTQKESGGGVRGADQRKSGALEVIIVTARKRAERIQDVPISIGVVSEQDIDRRVLVSAEDYLRGIPGVAQTGRGHNQTITIRGIETSTASQNFGNGGATVATYFGETPTTGSGTFQGATAIDIRVVDVERVEVLRGPQGTAFGSASLGGAVRAIPVAPKLDAFEGKLGASYGATSDTGGDNNYVQGIVNVPLITDKLAVRAVGYRYDDSGFYTNVAGSDPTFQARAASFGISALAVDEEEAGAVTSTGGRVAVAYQATDALRATVSYLREELDSEGAASANTGTYEHALVQAAPEHGGTFSYADIEITNATVEYDFGWADLLGTYSYLTSTVRGAGGNDLRVGSLFSSSRVDAGHSAKTTEIRLATKLDGAVNGLIGVYIEDADEEYLANFVWAGMPGLNPDGLRDRGSFFATQSVEQTAAFAEVSWEFLSRLTLTGGVRAYDYDRAFFSTENIFTPTLPTNRVTSTAGGADGNSFRGNLSYKPTENALLYAGWSQGFRLGRPQVPLAAATCDLNNDGILDGTSDVSLASTGFIGSDEMDNYEIGTKLTLLDRRLVLDAAVYRMDWSDLPVRVRASGCVPPEQLYFYSANAGKARSEGIELQAQIQATSAFRVDIGGSYVNAEIAENSTVAGRVVRKGDQLPNAPEWNANLGLQYEFTIGGFPAFVRLDQMYVGSFSSDLRITPNTIAGDYIKVDASARVTLGNHLDVGLFARNLTNEDAFTSRPGGGPFYGARLRPRTIGLQLNYSMD